MVESNLHEGVYSEGVKVVYRRKDRTFLGLGFTKDLSIVKDEYVCGSCGDTRRRARGLVDDRSSANFLRVIK